MKNNPILKPAVCAAGILLLSGCYQTPEIDSQPDQAPKITVDAKSEYIVASKSADPVTFSISSNTPWQIESDSEAWCTVSPGASATSSLVADITVTLDDNTDENPRTATLSVIAEGVEDPVPVKITQNGKSNLEISAPSGEIPEDGGNVTFTVTSNKAWTISCPQTWISFSPDRGDGSDTPVTVTASAGPGSDRRTATVRVETEDDFRTINIVQEGGVRLAFGEVGDTQFSYSGETKTFTVDATMMWKISADDPDVTFNTASGSGPGEFSVTLPYSKYINTKTYTITLESDDETIDVEPQTMTITQESFATPVGTPTMEGNTLSAQNGTAYVKSRDLWKYGTFTWTFSDVDLSSGYFDINNWGADGIVLMIRFGGETANGTNDNLVGLQGNVQIDGKTLWWAIDTGWGGGWPIDFKYNTEVNLSELRTLKFEIKPDTRDGNFDGLNKKCLSRKLWINDVLVFEFSKTYYPETESARPGDPAAWCGADIWQSGSTHPGLQYQFGIGGNGNGSMTIDSFEYKPIE